MKKKIIALFTSFLLIIPVFTVPVYAEDDITYYWSGDFVVNGTTTTMINGINTYYNTGKRVLFNYVPTHKVIGVYTNTYTSDVRIVYIWYIGTYSDATVGNANVTLFKNKLKYRVDTVAANSNTFISTNSGLDISSYDFVNGSDHNFYVYTSIGSSQGVYFDNTQLNICSVTNVYNIVGSYLGYLNTGDVRAAYSTSQNVVSVAANLRALIYSSDYYFNENVITAFSGLDSTPVVDPGTGYGDGSSENNGTGSAGSGSGSESGSGSGSGSMQQQQQIAEGAVQVTNNSSIESDAVNVNISDGITEETIQRLDQTLQNNNPYQTTFSTAVQTIDGFRQIGVKFAQTSEAFLAFLPSWVTDLLSLMFVLLFFFIVLRLLKVFHG